MRKCSLSLAVIAVVGASLWSYPANAVTTLVEFTVSPFDAGAPNDPVSGSFIFEKSATDFSFLELPSAINLTIGSHTYSRAEIFIRNDFAALQTSVGAGINGASLAANTDDFLLVWDIPTGVFLSFLYSTASSPIFVGNTGTITFTPVSEVPLPGALPLFATGLGALGLLAWRRKRNSATA
jgi:hypothetical protein